MLDAKCSGKLIKTPEFKIGQSGNHYTQFLLSVTIGEEQAVVVSGMSFGETAERIARLQKGEPLAVIGSLKPSEWQVKNTNELKHGLSVTVSSVLTVYDIIKRREATPKPDTIGPKPVNGNELPYDDNIDF